MRIRNSILRLTGVAAPPLSMRAFLSALTLVAMSGSILYFALLHPSVPDVALAPSRSLEAVQQGRTNPSALAHMTYTGTFAERALRPAVDVLTLAHDE